MRVTTSYFLTTEFHSCWSKLFRLVEYSASLQRSLGAFHFEIVELAKKKTFLVKCLVVSRLLCVFLALNARWLLGQV